MKRTNYRNEPILLEPGRYRVHGFPPMTGLLLNKWIEVRQDNKPGCYGPADLDIARTIPNLSYIEDEQGNTIWKAEAT